MALQAPDILAIQNLVYRYTWHIDHGDFAAMAALFARAVVILDPAGTFDCDPKGLEGVFREYVRVYADGTPRTRHVTTNLIIDPEGDDQASSSSSVVVFQQTDALALQPIIVTRNLDRFVRTEGEWHFSERRIEMNFLGDLSAHMMKTV